MSTCLPIRENVNARKFGFAIKLVPVYVDGIQTAWEQVHIASRATEVRRDSVASLRAQGHRASFVEYDPILDDDFRRAAKGRCKPQWTGD
jgi:hypothetical protein